MDVLAVLTVWIGSAAVPEQAAGAFATPSAGTAPLAVSFSGTPPGASLYEWQFDHRGGPFIADYSSGASPAVTFTYAEAGTFTARLRVFDAATGLPSEHSVQVVVLPPPAPPVVTLTLPPGVPEAGTNVTFTAAAAASPGRSIVSYAWEVDGVAAAVGPGGATASFTRSFATFGVFDVAVRAVDSGGLVGSDRKTVKVHAPPKVDIAPLTALPPVNRHIDFRATTQSGPWVITGYSWKFIGDTTTTVAAPGGAESVRGHSYPLTFQSFQYVEVTATDERNASTTKRVILKFNESSNPGPPGPMVLMVDSDAATGRVTYTAGAVPTSYPGNGRIVRITQTALNRDFTLLSPYWGRLVHDYDRLGSVNMDTSTFDSDGARLGAINAISISNMVVPCTLSSTVDGVATQTARVGHVVTVTARIQGPSQPPPTTGALRSLFDFQNDGVLDEERNTAVAAAQVATVSAPFQYSEPGVYTVAVRAQLAPYVDAVVGLPITVVSGTGAAEAWIAQPPDGAVVWGNHVTVRARTSPASRTSKVQFQYRRQSPLGPWITIATVVPPPHSSLGTAWDVTGLVRGAAYEIQAVVTDTAGGTFSSRTLKPVAVTVPVNLAQAQQQGQIDVDGVVQSQVQLTSQTARVDIANDTAIELPPEAVSAYTVLRMERPLQNPHPVEARLQGLTFVPGSFRRISLDAGAVLKKPTKVSVYDSHQDVLRFLADLGYNSLNAAQARLAIYRFDDLNSKWVPLPFQVSQPQEDLVRASTIGMGDLGLVIDVPGRRAPSDSSSDCGALGIEAFVVLALARLAARRRILAFLKAILRFP